MFLFTIFLSILWCRVVCCRAYHCDDWQLPWQYYACIINLAILPYLPSSPSPAQVAGHDPAPHISQPQMRSCRLQDDCRPRCSVSGWRARAQDSVALTRRTVALHPSVPRSRQGVSDNQPTVLPAIGQWARRLCQTGPTRADKRLGIRMTAPPAAAAAAKPDLVKPRPDRPATCPRSYKIQFGLPVLTAVDS